MNKSNYIKPETVEIEVETVEMLAQSNDPSVPVSPDEVDSSLPGHSNFRRGSWGDLWN